MPSRPLTVELAEIHAQQRQLRRREAQVLSHLADQEAADQEAADQEAGSPYTPRPGWPMQRLPDCRAT